MIPWLSPMGTGQKRQRQGSSSQPSKKPLLDVQKQGSSQTGKKSLPELKKLGSHKSKGNHERILKPNISITNSLGDQDFSDSSKGRSLFKFFPELHSLYFWEAGNMDIKNTSLPERSTTRLSDYRSTLVISAPKAQALAQPETLLCIYMLFSSVYSILYFPCRR